MIGNILSENGPNHEGSDQGPSYVNCEEVLDIHEKTMMLIKARGTNRMHRCCSLTM